MATIDKRRESYRVQIRVKGKKPVCKSFKDKKQAEQWASMMERGESPRKALYTTLGDMLEAYQAKVTQSPYCLKTIGHFKNAAPELLKLEYKLISLRDLKAFIEKKRKQNTKDQTIYKMLTQVSKCIEWHRDDVPGFELIHNIVKDLKFKQPKPKRRRRVQGNELELILDTISAQRTRTIDREEVKDIVRILCTCPFRRSELILMRVWQFDEAERRVYLPETKTGEERFVYLTTEAFSLLQARVKGKGRNSRVFSILPNRYTEFFQQVKERAGIVNFRSHDYRREATSRLFERGWTIGEVKRQTGHATIQSLDTYVCGSDIRVRELAKAL